MFSEWNIKKQQGHGKGGQQEYWSIAVAVGFGVTMSTKGVQLRSTERTVRNAAQAAEQE